MMEFILQTLLGYLTAQMLGGMLMYFGVIFSVLVLSLKDGTHHYHRMIYVILQGHMKMSGVLTL